MAFIDDITKTLLCLIIIYANIKIGWIPLKLSKKLNSMEKSLWERLWTYRNKIRDDDTFSC